MHESCPYKSLSSNAWWSNVEATYNPTQQMRFKITTETPVASAGSCFAQHIRNHLVAREFNYIVTEQGDPSRGFGLFPARFGNVYTTPQLLQLFERAFGTFRPAEDHWVDSGAFFDPYRPHVEPNGFETLAALREDRVKHLEATRLMFTSVNLFIFTLGLTEAWRSRIDGAVFQVCPGASRGVFNPDLHEFVNFDFAATTDAMSNFVTALQAVNPAAKIILTVSPVPLTATMTGNNVIQATAYSKSVLRIAAETIRNRFDHVDYFPSYEMVTGRPEEFFAADGKTIMSEGAQYVMECFLRQISEHRVEASGLEPPPPTIVCDEETALLGLAHAST